MASIAKLSVILTANTGRFQKNMSKGAKTLTRFKSVVGAATAAAGVMAAAIASIGVIASRLDRVGKSAQKLGIGVAELTRLQHAASMAGIEANTLTMGLQRMTRRVAEAAQGTGEAKDAISQLGLDAKELAGLSPDMQFIRIAEAMKSVGLQGERIRLSFKLFDSEGVDLVRLLKSGEKGIANAAREADFFGATMTELEASTVAQVTDSFTKLGASVGGLVKDMVVGAAPAIIAIVDGLTATVAWLRKVPQILKDIKSASGPLGVIVDAVSHAANFATNNPVTEYYRETFEAIQGNSRALTNIRRLEGIQQQLITARANGATQAELRAIATGQSSGMSSPLTSVVDAIDSIPQALDDRFGFSQIATRVDQLDQGVAQLILEGQRRVT